jgi:polysaccharide pyruvyl transferase WcaK-like protein
MITVRDENSRSILQDIGVDNDIEVTTDPTVLLGTAVEGKPRGLTSPPRVIVSVRHWFDKGFYIEDSEANRVFMESLASAVNYLVEQHSARVDFVPMRTTSYDDDRTVAAEVVSLMKHGDKVKVHTRAPEVDEFVRMTGRSSLIIGMRLHSLIIGASSGVPIIGLEYMPKVRAFMDSISQSEYSLDLNRVTSKQIIHTIEKTLSEYDIRTQKMISEISSLQKIAKNALMKLVQLSVCSD